MECLTSKLIAKCLSDNTLREHRNEVDDLRRLLLLISDQYQCILYYAEVDSFGNRGKNHKVFGELTNILNDLMDSVKHPYVDVLANDEENTMCLVVFHPERRAPSADHMPYTFFKLLVCDHQKRGINIIDFIENGSESFVRPMN